MPRLASSLLVPILLADQASAQATWSRQSPLPYPPQPVARRITFAQRAYIVGSDRVLLESTDQGASWHARPLTGTTFNEEVYGDVAFADALHGWLVGQTTPWSNANFRTVDGGTTWQQMATMPHGDWAHASFVSPTLGWVGTWGQLLITTDGGQSWQTQNLGVNGRCDAVAFRDANVGLVAAAGAILRTGNGGQSWTQVRGETAHRIVWLDANTVLASTTEFGSVADFARSTDAGVSWQPIDIPGIALQQPVRIDATTLVAGNDDGDLYRSIDAGSSWVKVWNGVQAASMTGGVFVSATNGFVLEAGNLLLRTDDGGRTWAYSSNGWAMDLNDIKMFSATHGLACGGGGSILRTVNAGHTWTPTRPGWILSNGAPLMDLSLVPPSFAFAAGDHGTMVKSLDGGDTWQRVQAPLGFPGGGVGDYWACHFISPTEGWLGGGFFELTHTTDGGATWQQQFVDSASSSGVYDLDFVDAQHGWAVGTTDGVMRTTNGGATWTFAAFGGLGPHARAVDFVDPQVGWAASRDGWIARSVDGGLTWTQQATLGSGVGTNLFSLHAISRNECWAATEDDGRVFYTTNGGNAWRELVTPFHDDYDGYRGIRVTATGDIYVAGSRGAVSRFGPPLALAGAVTYGNGCGGTGGVVPALGAVGVPNIGNSGFAMSLRDALALAPTVLIVSSSRAAIRVGACDVLVGAPLLQLAVTVDSVGRAQASLPVPALVTLAGLQLHGQQVVVDPRGQLLNVAALSNGLTLTVGY
jgi:photosystem II stability/assembly factor-like uncharacterized protein